jgi:hypothetical protein
VNIFTLFPRDDDREIYEYERRAFAVPSHVEIAYKISVDLR